MPRTTRLALTDRRDALSIALGLLVALPLVAPRNIHGAPAGLRTAFQLLAFKPAKANDAAARTLAAITTRPMTWR